MSANIVRENEIQITPEMEAAGIAALRGYDPEWDSSGEFAIRVFRAMAAVEAGMKVPSEDDLAAPVVFEVSSLGCIRRL